MITNLIIKNLPPSRKGCIPWNKGKKLDSLSEEHKRKLSIANKGKIRSEETRNKIRLAKLGNKNSLGAKRNKEWKQRMSKLQKGKKHSEETKRKISLNRKGKGIGKSNSSWKGGITQLKYLSRLRRGSLELANKLSHIHRGEKNHSWKGGITPINKKIRRSLEYRLWREAVFKRDNYTCIWCELRSGKGRTVILHADHIKPFSLFPELRFAIDNGRTLCVDCHKKTDTYAGKLKNYK